MTETDMDMNNRGRSAPSEHRTTDRLAPGTGPHYLEETGGQLRPAQGHAIDDDDCMAG